MTPDTYQRLAMRTQAPQGDIAHRVYVIDQTENNKATHLSNAVRGLADDAGEVNAAVKKWLEYGQELDETNLIEEVGDVLWRLAQICDALGVTLSDVMLANIKKLQTRYPDQYSDQLAKEENRDREKEREAISGGSNDSLTLKQATAISKSKVAARSVINKRELTDDRCRVTETVEEMVQNGQGFAEPPEKSERVKEPIQIDCPDCEGEGDVLNVPNGGSIGGGSLAICPRCDGTGKITPRYISNKHPGKSPYTDQPTKILDGWETARRIAKLFNSPREQRTALAQIESAEREYKRAKGQ